MTTILLHLQTLWIGKAGRVSGQGLPLLLSVLGPPLERPEQSGMAQRDGSFNE